MLSVKEILLSDLWYGTYTYGRYGKVHVQGRRKFPERGKINDFSKWVTFAYIDNLYKERYGKSITESNRWTRKD